MIDPSLPSLLKKLHSSDRYITQSYMCGFPSKFCLLNYLDCPDLFITDTGFVWSRKQLLSSKRDPILYRHYLNMTYPDRYCRLPWILLLTNNKDVIWLPVIQLLGWSFCPQTDTTKKYYYLKEGNVLHAENLINSDEKRFDLLDKNSMYFAYIDSIYDKLSANTEITLDKEISL